MPKLRERGAESRKTVIAALLDQPSQTEEELAASTKLGKGPVRTTLQLLLKTELAASKRRKRTDGRRGQGPIEYWLTTQHKESEDVEEELRQQAAELDSKSEPEVLRAGRRTVTVHATPIPPLYVMVKAGTNDAVLTKDGRMLRVEQHALKQVREQYERVLKGIALESMPLEDYYRRFYPELKGRREPPVF